MTRMGNKTSGGGAGCTPLRPTATASEVIAKCVEGGAVVRGRTVVVTGASRGIGWACVRALVDAGARVVMACRSVKSAQAVVDSAFAHAPELAALCSVLELDLCSFASVRAFARALHATRTNQTIDVLILNAGGINNKWSLTPQDGWETTMQQNHLGHMLLVRLVEDLLPPHKQARIVYVNSFAHLYGKPRLPSTPDAKGFLSDVADEKKHRGFAAYCDAKLSQMLTANVLSERLHGKQIGVFAVNPGTTDTDLVPGWLKPLSRRAFLTPSQGAATVLFVAFASELEGHGFEYWGPKRGGFPRREKPLSVVSDVVLGNKVWEASEKSVGAVDAP